MARSADIAHLAEIGIPSSTPSAAATPGSDGPVSARVSAKAAVPAAAVPDDQYDYGADADPDQEAVAQAFADLDKLTLQAERVTELRKRAEDQLQKLKQQEEQLLNKDIPELLAKMRLDDCVTSSGIAVKVKRDIKVTLPGHDRIEARMGALRWLVEHGHGGIIKNQVSVALDRGEDSRADELVGKLRAEGYDVEAKKDVHAMTLSALGRELVADGKIIPREYFNYFDMRIAKLTRK
jgi:hypothetical protein